MRKRIESSEAWLPPSRILVAIDGSENSNRALELAATMAKSFDSELMILNVIPAPTVMITVPIGFGVGPNGVSEYYSQQELFANQFVENAVSMIKSKRVTRFSTEVIRASKSVVEEIIETAARRKVNLLVIGTRGLGGFRKLLQGSVSSGVVTHATCDVLVVR